MSTFRGWIIPLGFELVSNDDVQVRLREKDGDGYIAINIYNEDFGRLSMDSEETETRAVKVNRMDGQLSTDGRDNILFWYDGYHFISILSNIDEVELLNIAENIKKLDEAQ